MNLEEELRHVLNIHSRENLSDTPDFILATYLLNCLEAYEAAIRSTRNWYRPENDYEVKVD